MRLFPVGVGTYAPSLSSAFLILLIFQRGYAKTAAEQTNEYRGIGKARQRCRVRYTLSLVEVVSRHNKPLCVEILRGGDAEIASEKTKHRALAHKKLLTQILNGRYAFHFCFNGFKHEA